MAMQRESLEVLEQVSVPPAQARAIVRAIEIELAGAKDTLATKHDIVLLRQDIEVGRADLRREMAQQGADLRSEIARQGEELHRAVNGATRQMYFAVLGQMAVMLGLVYFLFTELR